MAGFLAGAGNLLMGAYNSLPEINAATLSGAIDIVVVEQDDGSLLSSPFHIRFGRFKVLRKPRDRIVKIIVNDQLCDFVMRLGPAGEAHFLEETDETPADEELISPMLSPRRDSSVTTHEDSGSSPSNPDTPLMSPDAIKPLLDPTAPTPTSLVTTAASTKDGVTPPLNSWSWSWGRLPKQVGPDSSVTLTEALEQQLLEKESPHPSAEAEGEEEEEGEEGGREASVPSPRQLATPTSTGPKLSILCGEEEPTKQETTDGPAEGGSPKPTTGEPASARGVMGNVPTSPDPNGGGESVRSASPTVGAAIPGHADRVGNFGEDANHVEGRSVPSTTREQGLRSDTGLTGLPGNSFGPRDFEDVDDAQEEDESEPISRRLLLQVIQLAMASEQHPAAPIQASGESVDYSLTSAEPSPIGERAPIMWGDLAEGGMALDRGGWTRACQGVILLSLCGREIACAQGLTEQRQVFMRHRITAEMLRRQATDLSTSTDLCVAVKGCIYRWQVFAPAIMSALCLNEDLPLQYHHQLLDAFPTDRRFQDNRRRGIDGEGGDDGLPDHLLDLDASDSIFLGHGTGAEGDKGKYYRKTLIPSSQQLRCLPLRPGANTIRFYLSNKASVDPVSSSIFLWKAHDRVVISDVDGTITKSDALGHLLPRVGIQWAQKGVPQLLTAIKANDYRILYLTARPIGQVDATKAYLQGVKEDGVHLPLGPVITSPDGLFKSLNREIVQRRPEEFKIECLKNLQKLFAPKPFYAGFGNKGTDAVSYRAVNVPDSRILIINPQGEIHNELNQAYTTSYDGLRELVDLMFPFVAADETQEAESAEYSNYSYWKLPGLPKEEPEGKEVAKK